MGTIAGRPVVVAGDDGDPHAGGGSKVGNERFDRLMRVAVAKGMPLVYLAQSRGLRRPDASGSEGLAEHGAFLPFRTRMRQVPMATAILGDSFEDAAVLSALGDFTVQVRGAKLQLTDGGGSSGTTGDSAEADAHLRRTGLVDLAVDTPDDALDAVRRFLSFLPPNIWTPAPRSEPVPSAQAPDPALAALVPRKRARAYDMRTVISRLVDPAPGAPEGSAGDFLELRPGMGRGLVTGLGRIDGWPVAILASNPMFQAGSVDPAACEKGVRMLALCDSFQIPAVFLQDVVGFLVGRQVEHGRMLFRAVRLLNALYACSAPTLTVLVRKAFGLAYESLNGRKYHTDGLYAWPGAEIGFMDPEIGVNVLYGDRKTVEEKRAIVAELREGNSPFDAAAHMNIDEVIDPATTRMVLARDLGLLAARRVPPPEERTLRYWPTC